MQIHLEQEAWISSWLFSIEPLGFFNACFFPIYIYPAKDVQGMGIEELLGVLLFLVYVYI